MIPSLQSQTDRCFNKTELDSIYSKLIVYKYLSKEYVTIKYLSTLKDKEIKNLNSQVGLLEGDSKIYTEIIENKDILIFNNEQLLKEYKRKHRWDWLKGGVIGAGVVFLITNL